MHHTHTFIKPELVGRVRLIMSKRDDRLIDRLQNNRRQTDGANRHAMLFGVRDENCVARQKGTQRQNRTFAASLPQLRLIKVDQPPDVATGLTSGKINCIRQIDIRVPSSWPSVTARQPSAKTKYARTHVRAHATLCYVLSLDSATGCLQ